MRHGMVRLGRLVNLCAVGLLVGGLLGRVHPLGDSLAVFGGVFAAAVLLTLPLARWPRRGTAGVILCLILVMAPRLLDWAAGSTVGDAESDQIVLYQKNLLFRSADRAALLDDIQASGATVLTLQEVSQANQVVLTALRSDMPSQLLCPFSTVGAVAVASSLLPTGEPPVCDKGLAALQVVTPDGPLWLVSIHLHWPWPHKQAEQMSRLLPLLEAFEGPVVVAGDFNMTPYAHILRAAQHATATRRPRPVQPTFQLPYIPMGVTIDHVLVPRGSTADITRRPTFSSDHRGLVAHIAGIPR